MERDYDFVRRLSDLFYDLGVLYDSEGIARTELHPFEKDGVHVFYRSMKDPFQALHIQGCVGLSTETEIKVQIRTVDWQLVLLERNKGVAVGNEHEAEISRFDRQREGYVDVPHDASRLKEIIGSRCELFR